MRITLLIALACALSCTSDEPASAASGGTGGAAGTGGFGGGITAGVSGTSSGGIGSIGGVGGAGSAGTLGGGGCAGTPPNAGTGGAPVDMDAAVGDAYVEPPRDAGAAWTTRAFDPGPSYMGSGGGGCNTSYASTGHAPVDEANGKHPLFLYFVGTSFSDADESSQYTSPAAAAVTEAMARRGFVALSVDYDNALSLDFNKATCAFDSTKPESMLSIACALPEVDCALGIATWGHSQGAAIAHGAATYDDRVRAVWTTGYGGGASPLSTSRLRVVNGENDTMNGPIATLNAAAGFSASECPDDGRSECLRADGSGWILVRESACETNSADHCWFDKANCIANAVTLEPAWVDADSTAPFALEANADWVAATATRL